MNEETTNSAPEKPPVGIDPLRKVFLIILGIICLVFTVKSCGLPVPSRNHRQCLHHRPHPLHRPQVTGVVKAVAVENNTRVKAGDLLVQIDPDPFDAQLSEAIAKNEKAQGDYQREQGLASTRVVSIQDLAHARDDASAAAAEQRMAELNRRYTTIVSPVDGVVGGRNVEAGNTVQPSINLLAVVEGNPWVEANFKETQVAHILPGQMYPDSRCHSRKNL